MVLSLESCTSALHLLSEYILIAQFSHKKRKTTEINTPTKNIYDINTDITNNTLLINNIQFMNQALLSKLGFSSSSLPPPLLSHVPVILLLENEKHYCTITLSNAKNETQQFFGICKINYDDVCVLKLQEQELEEHLYLSKYYNSLGLFMTIVELGPEDGTYEWRHVSPNPTCLRSYNASYEKISSFTAAERNTLRERKHFHAACMDSKLRGIQSPVPMDVTDTYVPLLYSVIAYVGAHPITKRDLFACALRDPKTMYAAEHRVRELGDFFEYAPMLMGAVKLAAEEISTLYVNNALALFCGIPQKEFTSLSFSKIHIFSPDMVDVFVHHFKQSREHRDRAVEFQILLTGADEKQHYFAVTISTITYNKDTLHSTHVFNMLDVTTQKQAENALTLHKNSLEATVHMRTIELHEKELRFRSLVSNVPNVVLTVDRNGNIEYANRHFIMEKSEEILVGKCLPTFVENSNSLTDKIGALFESSKSFITEIKLREADIWLNISAAPMSEFKAIIVATDITENKKMSEELHHALTTKSRFLANMSHEVRTPLSGIIGMSRILRESVLTMDQVECVATIENCGETLLSVINDVLDYTKLEATGMTLESTEISLRQCLEESIYTVVPAAQKKKLELIVDIDTNIPDRILGDMLRLRQVVINLLNNAVKFTETGYVMISLVGREVKSDEWSFKCSIQDTGCGVPPESQSKLFQMFSQVDISSTRRYGGTGIGLALARRFLEMMNGNITMESKGIAGLGSTFTFNLSATVSPFTPMSFPISSTPRGRISGTRVFIIEELAMSCEVLKKRLLGSGFTNIQSFLDLDLALVEISACQPQESNIIVFCNVEKLVPGKSYPALLHLNIVTVLMGYIQPTNFETEYSKFEYLRKPIKQGVLFRCLREIWSRFSDISAKSSVSDNSSPRNGSNSNSNSNSVFPLTPRSTIPESKLNILVVEDNEMNQKIVRRVFQHFQYSNIPIANHGQEALDMIQANGMPDLILMDVQMPILDGVETTKIIRKKFPSDSWPYIVSMTADAFPEDRRNCLDAGMNDFLTKPIRVEQLQATLQKCIKLKETKTKFLKKKQECTPAIKNFLCM